MILTLLIFICFWKIGIFSELYDVTTIYRIDEPPGGVENGESPLSVEIHARTNALGLPFLVASNLVEPMVGVEVPCCMALRLSHVRCDWEKDNWEWTVWDDAPLLDTGDWTELKVTSEPSEFLRFDESLFIRLNGFVHNQSYINIVLTPSRAFLQNQKHFYYVQLSRLHNSFFYRCDNNIFERFTRFRDHDDSIISVHCDRLVNITEQMEVWEYGVLNSANFLLIEIMENGTIWIWNTKEKTERVMEWVDPQPIPVNFFTIRTDEVENTQVTATNYGKRQVLSMSKNANTATIKSPPLILSTNKICVSVVYLTHQSTTPTVVSVSYANQTIPIGELDQAEDGWKVSRLSVTLPESVTEAEVTVYIRSVRNEGELLIQRIAGCNVDDVEDIATIAVIEAAKVLPNKRIAYNVAVKDALASMEDVQMSVGECQNGGLSYGTGKCACPAGFSGDYCEIGCGANRYGHDCSGECSVREQGCRGLTLCTPLIGCYCAPGFKGYFCNETCGLREYGVSCSQKCRNCAGRCDVFTGLCPTSCLHGFYPPLCKTVYSYTQFAPLVTTIEPNYGEVIVVPDISTILGQGNPAFYQIQFKLAEESVWQVHASLPIISTNQSELLLVIRDLEHGQRYHVRVILIDQDLNSYDGLLVPYREFLTTCYIPEEYDYNLHVETTDTTIFASWMYHPVVEYRCPVLEYEVWWQEGWRWLSRNIPHPNATLMGKLPLTQYRLKVRALTVAGSAPFSATLVVRTKKQAPGPVSNITLISANSHSLNLAWNPPQNKENFQLSYIVYYRCRKLAACNRPCHSEGGEAHVTDPHVTLHGLLPLAQYEVTVAAVDANTTGPNVTAVYASRHTVPNEEVKMSESMPNATDTSITVRWDPVDVCSSFFNEYAYQLYQDMDLVTVVRIGTTKETFTSFENLEPNKTYHVKVFIATSAGQNFNKFLLINATTTLSDKKYSTDTNSTDTNEA